MSNPNALIPIFHDIAKECGISQNQMLSYMKQCETMYHNVKHNMGKPALLGMRMPSSRQSFVVLQSSCATWPTLLFASGVLITAVGAAILTVLYIDGHAKDLSLGRHDIKMS